jgi:hypothetical protein
MLEDAPVVRGEKHVAEARHLPLVPQQQGTAGHAGQRAGYEAGEPAIEKALGQHGITLA